MKNEYLNDAKLNQTQTESERVEKGTENGGCFYRFWVSMLRVHKMFRNAGEGILLLRPVNKSMNNESRFNSRFGGPGGRKVLLAETLPPTPP